jgi:hypothetical protein
LIEPEKEEELGFRLLRPEFTEAVDGEGGGRTSEFEVSDTEAWLRRTSSAGSRRK